jgi:hypothetical protein
MGLVAVWLWSLTPWSQSFECDRWEERLSLQLGFHVEIQQVDYLGPHAVELMKVELKHAETGASIATLDSLTLRQNATRSILHIPSCKIELRQLAGATDILHREGMCRPQLGLPLIDAKVDKLDIEDDGVPVDSFRLDVEWLGRPEESRLQLAYRPLKEEKESGRIELVRKHLLEIPETYGIVQTGTGSIGYSMLNAFFPMAKELGPNVDFRGTYEWLSNQETNKAALSGVFNRISWGHMTSSLPFEMTGSGQIELQHALCVDGRISHIEGSMRASSGRISRDWLHLGQDRLGLAVIQDVLQAEVASVPFNRLSVGFRMTEEGLLLRAGIPSNLSNYAPSLLADDRDGLVYLRDPSQIIAIDRLVDWITASPSIVDRTSIQPASHLQASSGAFIDDRQRTIRRFLPLRTSLPVGEAVGNGVKR